MIDLEILSDFVLVAANGGIAQASRASGRPKASLSRKVMELEASLGVRLFERGSRSIRMTEEGELLYARTTGPLSEISEVVELLRDGRAKPRGRLRISVPQVFGQLTMGRLAAEFSMAYPEVTLEITTEDRAVDLVSEGYDLVIRANPKPDESLAGRVFTRDPLLIVAAPSLSLRTYSPPTDEPLPIVVRSSMRYPAIWKVPAAGGREVNVRTVLQLPTFPMVRDAVLTGIGAAILPQALVVGDMEAGRLVSWGAAFDRPSELWALHPSSRLASAKVKAFMRFLDTAFPRQ